MNEFIKDIVNYVIEAKDYRGDQSAELYRVSRIHNEINPGDPAEKRAAIFRQINKDYREEKRLERAPRGPQTRPVIGKGKPMEEGIVDLYHKGKEGAKRIAGEIYRTGKDIGGEISQTGKDVKDAIVGGKRVPNQAPQKPESSRIPIRPKPSPTFSNPTPSEIKLNDTRTAAEKASDEAKDTADKNARIAAAKQAYMEKTRPQTRPDTRPVIDNGSGRVMSNGSGRVMSNGSGRVMSNGSTTNSRNTPIKPGADLQSQGLIVSPTRSIPNPARTRTRHSSEDPNNKYHIGPPIKEGIVNLASRGLEAVDKAIGSPLTYGIRAQGEKDRERLKAMMDSKGSKGKIVPKPQANTSATQPANPFSKDAWQSRKERMDKAIDS